MYARSVRIVRVTFIKQSSTPISRNFLHATFSSLLFRNASSLLQVVHHKNRSIIYHNTSCCFPFPVVLSVTYYYISELLAFPIRSIHIYLLLAFPIHNISNFISNPPWTHLPLCQKCLQQLMWNFDSLFRVFLNEWVFHGLSCPSTPYQTIPLLGLHCSIAPTWEPVAFISTKRCAT